MKRAILTLLIIVTVLLVACNTTPSTTDDTTQEEQVEDTTPEVEQQQEETTQAPRADLQPELNADTFYPDGGETLTLTASTKNGGFGKTTKDTFSWKVTLTRDGTQLKEETGTYTGTLLASEDATLHEFDYQFSDLGTYEYTLTVDTENTVPETKEDNNEKTVKIYVREAGAGEVQESTTSDDEETTSSSSDDESSSDEVTDCTDSDGGEKEATQGTCTDASFPNGRDDFCSSDETLREFVCRQSECDIVTIDCDNICRNGVCL